MKKTASILAACAIAAASLTFSAAEASAGSQNDAAARIAAGTLGFMTGVIAGSAAGGKLHISPAPRRQVHVPTWRERGRWERPAPRYQWGQPWSREWHAWCSSNYRSFDPRTGTFRGYDGRVRFCEMPRH